MAIKKQFLKFIVVGFFSTTVNYSFFYLLYEFLGIYYLTAAATGFIGGVLAGYGFNKKWTFGIKETTQNYVYKYYIIYVVSLILSMFVLEFLVSQIGLTPEIANLLTIGFTTITNFIGIKAWVFKV